MSSVSLKIKINKNLLPFTGCLCSSNIFCDSKKLWNSGFIPTRFNTMETPTLKRRLLQKWQLAKFFFWLLDWKNHKSLIGKNTCKKWKKNCFNTFLSISLSFLVSFCFIKCLGLLNQNNFFIWSKIFSFEIDGTMIVQNWCHCWNGRIFS